MALSRPVVAMLALLCIGCRSKEPSGDAMTAGASSAPASGGAGAKPACPRTGHWTECLVFARLEQSGVAPRREGALPGLPALGTRPSVYTIGKVGLAVYLFPDSVSRARAARSLDTLHFVPPSAGLTTRGEATAIQNDNLLGLLFSRNDQQRERVSDGLMAGAPQR